MDYFRIQGGTTLEGAVKIRGAKNSALELIAASLLTDRQVVLKNVPTLADIETIIELLENHGTIVEWDRDAHTLKLITPQIKDTKAPYEIVCKMRASIYVLGALLGRCGEAKVSSPGGCAIGARPVGVHLDAMEALGAKVELHHGYIVAEAPLENGRRRLKGGRVDALVRVSDGVRITTWGGTVNALLAAATADGHTTIKDAAQEPEVDDLIAMLNLMGAKIERAGEDIEIDGVEKLHGCEYSVMPDRTEAGTYAIAALMTRGRIELEGADMSKLGIVIEKLASAGAKIEPIENGFAVDGRGAAIRPVDIDVAPYPGFPTDLQSPFMTLMCIADGTSRLNETIFENRLIYTSELARMCANIKVLGPGTAEFNGVKALCAADVMASDLRSGAALTIAGLVAEGETILHRVYHIYRGYENFVANLNALGAKITVEKEVP